MQSRQAMYACAISKFPSRLCADIGADEVQNGQSSIQAPIPEADVDNRQGRNGVHQHGEPLLAPKLRAYMHIVCMYLTWLRDAKWAVNDWSSRRPILHRQLRRHTGCCVR
ncbi:hypothetical protein VCV18_005096 [Metarhizium anisopliae]